MVMFFPLSRLRRQLSQSESQVPRVMHYTERCIEVRPCYLFDKQEIAGLFGSILSYGKINYKNSHSSANCCGCSLPYEHRPLCGVFAFQAFWISSSAICTQLVAAPLRT